MSRGYKLLTPGPTEVSEDVRRVFLESTINPDIDKKFYDDYLELCELLGELIFTKNDVRVIGGEGILSLEMVCASLTERGDRVLVIDNGIFGAGFGEFVELYEGEPVYFSKSHKRGINPKELKEFLEGDHDFKYATAIHCDTPTGVLNPIKEIGQILKEYDIPFVVDAIASIGGERVEVDSSHIDICLGATQKALSAPVGLTFLSVSKRAWQMVEKRKSPIRSYYANLKLWKDVITNQWFPYTMPSHEILAFKWCIKNFDLEDSLLRHKKVAKRVREFFEEEGIKLFLEDSYSDTVTAVELPNRIDFASLQKYLLEEKELLIASSLGDYNGKLLRVGHMGNNCSLERVEAFISGFISYKKLFINK